MTTCPMCAEDVATTDAVCPHCDHVLAPPPPGVGRTHDTAPHARAALLARASRVARQWAIPAALTTAVALALVVKFMWWERRWQGTPEACEVMTVLTTQGSTAEESEPTYLTFFGGSLEALLAFDNDLYSHIEELESRGTLRTHGISVREVERRYVAAVQRGGVPEESARETFRARRDEILRAIALHRSLHIQSEDLEESLRVAAAACSGHSSTVPASPTGTSVHEVSEPTRSPSASDDPQPAPTPPVIAPPPTAPIATPTPSVGAANIHPQRLVPTVVTASSFISNGRNQYAPERAFDGDPSTTWTEFRHGPGDGEWLQAMFETPQRIRRVRITTGWDYSSRRGRDLFTANSHLRRVRLVLSPSTTIERDVGFNEREVVFDGLNAETQAVRIEAISVWPGTRWADLCISEVSVEGGPL